LYNLARLLFKKNLVALTFLNTSICQERFNQFFKKIKLRKRENHEEAQLEKENIIGFIKSIHQW